MSPQAAQSIPTNPFSYFEQFTKIPSYSGMGNANMDALIEMNGITTRLYSELARENLKVMNELVQCGVEELQGLSQARGLEDVLNVISQSASKTSPTVFQHLQNVMDTVLNYTSDCNRLFEEGISRTNKATEKMYNKNVQRFTDAKDR